MGLSSKYDVLAGAGPGRTNLIEGLWARLWGHRILLKFAVTGITGYIVYQLVFLLFYDSSLVWFLPDKGETMRLLAFSYGDGRLLITTLVAAELSIVGVFWGHHLWTFRDTAVESKALWVRFAQFNVKAAVSSLVILNVVVNALILGVGVESFVAIPLGVATAFFWNWSWDSRFIWRPVERRDGEV